VNVGHEADDVNTLCTVNVDHEMQTETGGERCNNLGNSKLNIIFYFFLSCERAEFSNPAIWFSRSDSARQARCVFISRRDERTHKSFALQN